jgi:hypothetical protein
MSTAKWGSQPKNGTQGSRFNCWWNAANLSKILKKLSVRLLNFSPMDSNFLYHQADLSISLPGSYLTSLSQYWILMPVSALGTWPLTGFSERNWFLNMREPPWCDRDVAHTVPKTVRKLCINHGERSGNMLKIRGHDMKPIQNGYRSPPRRIVRDFQWLMKINQILS